MTASSMIAQHIRIWCVAPMIVAFSLAAQSDWTDKSPHKTAFITVNGVRLHYLDWGGKGETMLFLHGIGDTPHGFNGFAPKFTNQFHVLGLTRRGHGESEVTDSGYDTATPDGNTYHDGYANTNA
jgi:alpha-beta hydrolase superfamily lysophospholipase